MVISIESDKHGLVLSTCRILLGSTNVTLCLFFGTTIILVPEKLIFKTLVSITYAGKSFDVPETREIDYLLRCHYNTTHTNYRRLKNNETV